MVLGGTDSKEHRVLRLVAPSDHLRLMAVKSEPDRQRGIVAVGFPTCPSSSSAGFTDSGCPSCSGGTAPLPPGLREEWKLCAGEPRPGGPLSRRAGIGLCLSNLARECHLTRGGRGWRIGSSPTTAADRG